MNMFDGLGFKMWLRAKLRAWLGICELAGKVGELQKNSEIKALTLDEYGNLQREFSLLKTTVMNKNQEFLMRFEAEEGLRECVDDNLLNRWNLLRSEHDDLSRNVWPEIKQINLTLRKLKHKQKGK